jgi:RNA polymerase sigma-70 factor (ECF subfamily)
METSVSLLEGLVRGDGDAWERLVTLYRPLLWAWALRAGAGEADADDLVQEVLTVVFRELPRFEHRGPGAFRGWLRGILINRLRDFFRARQRRPIATGDSAFLERLDQLADAESALSRQWDREHDLQIAARLLDLVREHFQQQTWEAFTRHVLDDRHAADVAAELGVSVNVVLLARSRVLKRLRQELVGLVDA